jgi:F-box protein 24
VKDFLYKRVNWHSDFAKHVIDITSDPRYDNVHRRYVYVLTQSEGMRNRRTQHNTRSSSASNLNKGWNEDGYPIAGDKIDVFDERSCRRVFNMTFDPEMRFVSMKLTSVATNQKTLYILTDLGKVYSLHLYESSLLNLGSDGMQVTLKSVSKNMGDKVAKIESSSGITCFLTETGKMFVSAIRRTDILEIFGRVEIAPGIPQALPHVAKIVNCSVAEKHLGFIDEYNRLFMVGNNRCGQLGTGDRMDRAAPVQVLRRRVIRAIKCGLNHTLVIVENGLSCDMYGCGSGSNGRLPGIPKGTVQMEKLSVKVPWSVIQVDSHKECMFLLSCYDPQKKFEYKELQSSLSEQHIEQLSVKSQQELLMDVRRTQLSLGEKLRILETMVNHVIKGNQQNGGVLSEKFQQVLGSLPEGEVASTNKGGRDLELLRSAVEQVRLDVERVELDRSIADTQ